MNSELLAATEPMDGFKSWALQMGCPVNALPGDAALDRLIKSNLVDVQKLMTGWRPRSEVKLCRDNLLVSSVPNSNGLLERQQNQPNSWNDLKRKEKISRQIDELKPRTERLRAEFRDKKSSLFGKAEQLTEVKRTHRSTKAKSIQMEQKHAQLIEKIEVEKGFEKILASGMAVPNDVTTTCKSETENGIRKSLQYLRSVYAEIGDRELSKADRDEVQREIKKTLADFPVMTAYEAMKSYQEMNVARFNSIYQPPKAPIPSAFDVALTKSRVRMYVDHHLARKKLKDEYSARVEQYVQLYDQYLERMVNEMNSFNEPDVELFADSICGDYLKEYGTSIGNQAMLQFKQQKLSNLQQRVTERDDQLKGYDVVASELTNMYQINEQTYSAAYDDIVVLGDTTKSLKQLQALCIYTINSFGQRSKFNPSTNLLNATLGPVVSSMTLKSAEYKNELLLLSNLIHKHWNQLPASMDVQCQRPNEAISPFYTLLTPNGSLKLLKNRWTWHKAIEILTQSLDVNISVPHVADAESVAANLNAENTKMAKIVDEIRFMYQTGNQTVAEIRKYLQFLLDTSLGSLIPESLMINRRTFRDYEEEFLFACSLIANSMKRN
ncbi:augmin complex subunit dgt5 [Bradysia coprophila]|uniref:augmin complex subunit dgt5 n=1 Tax=Bradysia coprophila TaxID=38358 RepID=UPI00187D74B4|nr:augmin complex subunit dgt5 [Bradysia coprophila]XP_037049250.1 augmin complex subunit dgt5 [Bradysia coprophila]